jgi:hypothetical protein
MFYIYIYCTMLGVLDQLRPPTVPRYSTEDAIRIVNSFYYNPTQVTTINLSFISYAVMRLHNYNPYTFVTTITYSTPARLHSLQTLHSNLYCTITHEVS